jgi:hypothetical protein
MRSILIDLGSDSVVVGTAINARVEDVRIAACLLVGAASAAEAELAAHAWSPGVLAAVRPLGNIIKACNELEAALAVPAHMPSPATLATIAAVEAVRASMPSAATRATIGLVEAAQTAFPDPKTMTAIDQAVERFGVPAIVSTDPISPAEAAERLRDAPPRLTPADQAAFAAAAHSFPKGT